jgi:hypothetical protein
MFASRFAADTVFSLSSTFSSDKVISVIFVPEYYSHSVMSML